MLVYCQVCAGSPYHRYEKEASVQLCGFWLCRSCLEQAVKKGVVYRLFKLAENCVRHAYHVVWEEP
jgi:hypothetical protein